MAPDAYWAAPENFLAWLVNDSPVKDTVVFNDRCKCACTPNTAPQSRGG